MSSPGSSTDFSFPVQTLEPSVTEPSASWDGHTQESAVRYRSSTGPFEAPVCRQILCTLPHLTLWEATIRQACKFLYICKSCMIPASLGSTNWCPDLSHLFFQLHFYYLPLFHCYTGTSYYLKLSIFIVYYLLLHKNVNSKKARIVFILLTVVSKNVFTIGYIFGNLILILIYDTRGK